MITTNYYKGSRGITKARPSRAAPPHSSTLVDARVRPSPSRAVVRRHARRPPSRRVARARPRARARAVDDRAPVVRERPERAAQGALPVARPDESEQLEGGARASRDASRATATRDRSRDAATLCARSIDPRRPRRLRDANSTTDARRDARDATQVVFAVLGGWAVVIAGARQALS